VAGLEAGELAEGDDLGFGRVGEEVDALAGDEQVARLARAVGGVGAVVAVGVEVPDGHAEIGGAVLGHRSLEAEGRRQLVDARGDEGVAVGEHGVDAGDAQEAAAQRFVVQLERADAPGEGVGGQLRVAAQGFGVGVLALEMLGSEEEPFGPQGFGLVHGIDLPIGCIARPPARLPGRSR
jgi:hypothetical protein